MIHPKYLIYHDLIGIHVLAKLNSMKNNKFFLDIGIVIDETKNMLITEKDDEIKKYIKKDYVFRFEIPDFGDNSQNYFLEVEGSKIIGRPENRLRSLRRKKWLKK